MSLNGRKETNGRQIKDIEPIRKRSRKIVSRESTTTIADVSRPEERTLKVPINGQTDRQTDGKTDRRSNGITGVQKPEEFTEWTC